MASPRFRYEAAIIKAMVAVPDALFLMEAAAHHNFGGRVSTLVVVEAELSVRGRPSSRISILVVVE
jgi:hypothetical protein